MFKAPEPDPRACEGSAVPAQSTWASPVEVQPTVAGMKKGRPSAAGGKSHSWQDSRVLLVSADADERIYLRARLALAKLVWVDEATTTSQAASAMESRRYILAVFNLDVPMVDGLGLAKKFRQVHPYATCVVTSVRATGFGWVGLLGRWRLRQRIKELHGTGMVWLEKPLLPKKVALLFANVHSQRKAAKG